jgi:hypothetical protein
MLFCETAADQRVTHPPLVGLFEKTGRPME